jgi:hypothetical protein
MSIFTGAPIKSRIGTKSDVVRCGNNCLSYNANDGGLLSARCHRGSARRNILERLLDDESGFNPALHWSASLEIIDSPASRSARCRRVSVTPPREHEASRLRCSSLRSNCATPAASAASECGGRRSHALRRGPQRPASASRSLRGQNSQGRQTSRLARRAGVSALERFADYSRTSPEVRVVPILFSNRAAPSHQFRLWSVCPRHPLPLRRAMGFEPQRRYKVSFRRSIDGTL